MFSPGSFPPKKRVVLATERRHSERTLGPIVVERDAGVFEKSLQRFPLAKGVLNGLTHWSLGWVPRLLFFEPGCNALKRSGAGAAPKLEMFCGLESFSTPPRPAGDWPGHSAPFRFARRSRP